MRNFTRDKQSLINPFFRFDQMYCGQVLDTVSDINVPFRRVQILANWYFKRKDQYRKRTKRALGGESWYEL